jgi:zinc protease
MLSSFSLWELKRKNRSMRQLLYIVLATFFVLAPASAQVSSPPLSGPGDSGIFSTHLKNGLQVVVVEDHTAPVVETAMWYRFGSIDETPGKTGLAHALEHMMFRGTEELSSGGLTDVVARLGAQMNGQTSYDYTQFYFVMPSDKLDVALAIEADRMQHLLLRQSDWDIERGAVLNELAGDDSSPFFDLLARVRAAAFPNQPSGRTPIGRQADIEHATSADIAHYYHEWYAPNNATLVVAGDVDHDSVFSKAERDFGAIASRAVPPEQTQDPKPVDHTVTVESDLPFPFEIVDLAYSCPGDTEKGEPEINTLENLIPNQLSPFYQALVETNVALAIQTEEDTQLKGGLFHVFIVVDPNHSAAEARDIFEATMRNVLQNGFDTTLVAASKRLTIADRLYDADAVTGIGDLAGYTYGIVGEKVHDEDDRLDAITPESLLNVTRTYLSRPTVIGHLNTKTQSEGNSEKSNAAQSDDFSKRAPEGPIVEPPAIREAARTPTAARSKLNPTEFTLPNGIRVIVQQKPNRPTFVLNGEIASSPAFIPNGQEGVQRLASDLADYGSASYPFAQRRASIDRMGAFVQNGQSFSARGLVHDFDTIVKIVADGEEHPTFADPWFGIERSQIAGSLQEEATISGVMIDRAYAGMLAQTNDPSLKYASAGSVSALTRDDLVAYTKKYWRPDLTTIAVVGDVTPDQVRTTLTNAFADWSAQGPTPDAHDMPYASPHAGHDYVGTAATQVYIRLGQPALARNSPDYDTFLVLNQILGAPGAFESRLWQSMRQRRGLVYSVQSSLEAGRDRGDFRVEIAASPSRVVEAVQFVREQLRRLQDEPVSETELSEAKLRLVSDALLEEASADGQVGQLLDIATNGLPLDYYRTLNERFATITAADVQRVARKYLAPNDLVQIYAGPEGEWARQTL